jgi:thioredoxin 1
VKHETKLEIMKAATKRTLFVSTVVMLAAGLPTIRGNRAPHSGCCCPLLVSLPAFAAEAPKTTETNAPAKAALPRLVDLGADKCIPCRMMAPVLADLKTNYVGLMKVEFIDVWKNPEAGKEYKINLIPTQIFFDAAGKELFRHEGFLSKKDILAKWKELGVELKSDARNPKAERK